MKTGQVDRLKKLVSQAILLLLMSITVQCSSAESERVLSKEEIRLAASQRIDSTFVNPDSIGEKELQQQLSAQAWILVEDSTGLLISEKNAQQRMFPASLTKMMTAMLAIERGNMSDSIEITEDVFLTKDSRVRLGDRYLLGNLIREMMMESDNDAANAIAKHLSGNIPAFCQLMNERAAYLGMDSTHFANPNGMPNDSTYSSARDLLVLSRYCMRDSTFAQIVGTSSAIIPLIDGRHLKSQNTNLLLQSYEGCIGVKTGYTRQAGACLASAATRHGVTLCLVLLNSRSRSSRFTESAALLDYGFQAVSTSRAKR
jgi:D-alanyl-D-alanine carboxypeptidase